MRALIVGNSGSGKSTLARRYVSDYGVAHLDLDTVAWHPPMPPAPPTRAPLPDSLKRINVFLARHDDWVIEGCYADLLEMLAPRADELVYLDLSVVACVANARSRPWEPHKYANPAAQDESLEFLVSWIRAYDEREDWCSRRAHEAIFEQFTGIKRRVHANQ